MFGTHLRNLAPWFRNALWIKQKSLSLTTLNKSDMKSMFKVLQSTAALPRDNDSEKRHYLRFSKAPSCGEGTESTTLYDPNEPLMVAPLSK